MNIFKFDHGEGAEILAAANAKEAIIYYFTHYQDDLIIDDICQEHGGISIRELTEAEITKKHLLYDETENERNEYSYAELAAEVFTGTPVILVTPNY